MRKHLFLILAVLIIFSTGCQQNTPAPSTESSKTPPNNVAGKDYGEMRKLKEEAIILMNQKKYDEALKAISKAIDIEPRDDLLTKRADIYNSMKNYKEAEKDLQEALKISERDDRKVLIYSQLADIYNSQDENEKSLEAIKEVEKLESELPEDAFKELPVVYRTMGTVLCDHGEYSRAIKFFDKAIAKDPGEGRILYERGYAYYYLGNKEKAQEGVKEWLKTNPSTEDAENLRAIGSSYMILGEYDKALGNINKAIEKDPEDIGYLTDRAEVYILMGNKKAAAADLKKVLDKKPNGKWENKMLQDMLEKTK